MSTNAALAPDTDKGALPGECLGERNYRALLPADASFKSVMALPLVIPSEGMGSWLDIVRTEDYTTAVELLLDACKKAPSNVVMRWAGGCKGFNPEQVEQLFQLIAAGSISQDGKRAFRGAVGSGGTMDFAKDGAESVMICQVPVYMARLFECVAWGSTPQTYRLRLAEADGSVVVSKYGAHLDHRGHMNVLTQDSVSGFQKWDGDVRWYMDALQSFARHGYKVALGIVNGGDITLDEALLALSKGIPVIVVEGTDRAADQIVAAHKAGTVADLYGPAFLRGTLKSDLDQVPSADEISRLLHIVNFNKPAELSRTMDSLGLLTGD